MAHSRNGDGRRQPLVEHLSNVAELAAAFSQSFGGAELARLAGLWHDLGKFHPEFQQYLRDAEVGIKRSSPRPTHKVAGTCLAFESGTFAFLAILIAGHHGGLSNRSALQDMVAQYHGTAAVDEALALAAGSLGSLSPTFTPSFPGTSGNSAEGFELFLRMLFSALVDADFLDTEQHFESERAMTRGEALRLGDLWGEFVAYQEEHSGNPSDPINQVRHDIYRACLEAASQSPGFFRLTVPTGGGKTRSGLGFALRHALEHGQRRVIVAIPYTSITEQTASVFRDIFTDPRAVLEHHSAARLSDDVDPNEDGILADWSRLAAQNWDAPIVVTTTVQLFESLLGRSTSSCRKLHNIANSVIILDEVQTLPPGLLDPTLDVLRDLVENYRVSVVLCTATQPALDERSGFPGLPGIREIVPEPARLFKQLQRVTYRVHLDERWPWSRVADVMRRVPTAMAILNTKRDALSLLAELDDPETLHLSTLLCPAHRRAVLDDIRRRLVEGQPCKLIATQVVEAGVDLDFPVVLRALGPLDRIVQAAGRCNREGHRESGDLILFDPKDGGLPRGTYATGTSLTRSLLQESAFDFHDPATYERYFQKYYGYVSHDVKDVQEWRQALDYPEVAERYRLIADDTVPLIVHYGGTGWNDAPAGDIIERIQRKRGRPRYLYQALQQYTVPVRVFELRRLTTSGLALEVLPGLFQWMGRYDDLAGLGRAEADPERLVI